MRTLLIDPTAKTVTEHDHDGNWKTIAPAIGCDTFDVIFTSVGDIYVDDEGLWKSPEYFWKLDDMNSPIAGKGLVFGFCDEEGESGEAEVSVEAILKKLTFYTFADVADHWGVD